MPLTPTLFFAGNARDALDHYHTALGEGGSVITPFEPTFFARPSVWSPIASA